MWVHCTFSQIAFPTHPLQPILLRSLNSTPETLLTPPWLFPNHSARRRRQIKTLPWISPTPWLSCNDSPDFSQKGFQGSILLGSPNLFQIDAHLGGGQRSGLIGAQDIHGGDILQGRHAGDDGMVILSEKKVSAVLSKEHDLYKIGGMLSTRGPRDDDMFSPFPNFYSVCSKSICQAKPPFRLSQNK